MSVRVSKECYDAIKARAEKSGRTMAQEAEWLLSLEFYIQTNGGMR